MSLTNNSQSEQPANKNFLSLRIQRFQKENNFAPYIYGICSNLCLVGLQMYMKFTSSYITPLQALAIRGFFLLLLNSIVIHLNSFSLHIKDPSVFMIMVKRIFWSALTVSMFLAPLKYLPAGTVNALFNTAPIIVCFVEAVRYKKPLNAKHFVLTIISFCGILLIIQPDFLFGQSKESYEQYKYFLFFSLASAFTNSMSMSYLHDLQGKVPGTIALHYFYIGQCLFNSVIMMFEQLKTVESKTIDMNFFYYLFGLVISAYLTQNFMTRAIMLKKPSYIMPLGYITIVFSALMDFILFGNSFGTLSIVGMLLTSSGLLVKLLIPEEDKAKAEVLRLKETEEKF